MDSKSIHKRRSPFKNRPLVSHAENVMKIVKDKLVVISSEVIAVLKLLEILNTRILRLLLCIIGIGERIVFYK